MELVTVRIDGGHRAGRVEGEQIVLLEAQTVGHLLAEPDWRTRAAEDGDSHIRSADADLAPVIPHPPKIICVGVNYRDHIEEMGREAPGHPTYFAKYARALVGPRDDLVLPPADVSTNIDWEVELAVVIGAPCRNVSGQGALDAMAGFTVLNDVSVRDWQRRTSQFLAGKTFEGMTPVGPGLVTTDQVGDGSGLDLSTSVNGVVKQQSNTSHLVFNAVDIVSDLSRVMTLDPGDIIATGTPGGVGAARNPPEWLKAGDELVTTVEGVGTLTNRCR